MAWISTGPVTARVGSGCMWKAQYVEDGPIDTRVRLNFSKNMNFSFNGISFSWPDELQKQWWIPFRNWKARTNTNIYLNSILELEHVNICRNKNSYKPHENRAKRWEIYIGELSTARVWYSPLSIDHYFKILMSTIRHWANREDKRNKIIGQSLEFSWNAIW
jgi:hypothetical protein